MVFKKIKRSADGEIGKYMLVGFKLLKCGKDDNDI